MNLNELYSIREKDFQNLGNGVIPTESDLEEFKKWKKTKINKMLITCIYSLLILILVGCVLLLADIEASLTDKIFAIIAYLLFAYAEIFLINKYLKARHWKMEYCSYGKIIDKYYFSSKARNDNENTHIIVLIDGKKVNINTCSKSEYRKLQLNDEVIVFAVDDKKIYIIKK